MTLYLTEHYLCVADALHPRMHYAYGTSAGVMNDLREAFEFMRYMNTCVAAL
jgi:hypothetical protein